MEKVNISALRLLGLIFGFFLLAESTLAQETISGIVTDGQSEETLPGVNILVKGTSTGTSTDAQGAYKLAVESLQDTLVFSYIGYQTQQVPVNGQMEMDVALQPQTFQGEEMVVVGYGTKKSTDVTGSISSISSEDIADRQMTNISDGLVGRVSGLDISSSEAGPGSENQILLRGRRSFTASNDPLILVDGLPYNGSLNDINPGDIKSVDVLKDASSTAIYGARGANGVIIITTERGEKGSPQFSFRSYAGPKMRYGRIPYANAQQYADIAREAYRSLGRYPKGEINEEADNDIFGPIEMQTINSGGKGLNYQDILFQDGFQQKHQLGVSGGSEDIQYNFSGSYFSDEGIIPGEEFKRYSIRSNLDFDFSSSINAGTSILLHSTSFDQKTIGGATTGDSDGAINRVTGVLDQVYHSSPMGAIYDENGNPRFTATTDGLLLNPIADYEFDSYRRDKLKRGAEINGFTEIQIIPNLSYRINAGINYQNSGDRESAGYYSLSTNLGSPTASIQNSEYFLTLYESVINYEKTFFSDHNLTLTAIQGLQSTKDVSDQEDVRDVPYEPSRYYNLGSASTVGGVDSDLEETTLYSYAGRLDYDFQNKYLLTLSIRADGASQFSSDNKWGYFPSVALGYRISQEKFMQPAKDWLSELKLRISYGKSGNQGISPYQTQGGVSQTAYSWGDGSAAFGYRPTALANSNLKWETTSVYNIGLDFDLFEGRINGSFEAYTTKTNNLLMFRKLPITTGYEQVLQNVGSTKNKGIELQLNTLNIKKNNFSWGNDITFFLNRNQIVELYNGKNDDVGNRWFIGEPINVFYDFKKIGIWQQDEQAEAASYDRDPGQIKVMDLNSDGQITDSDRMILGSPEPDFVLNLSNRFNLKNWNFSFDAYTRWGGMTAVDEFAPFAKKRYNKIVFNYWTPSNPTNDYPRPNQLYEGSGLNGSTLRYREASYIMLRNATLGYNIPKSVLSKIGASNARVYVSGDNLFYWTKSELSEFNMKPDWSGSITLAYPAIRTFAFGVNIDF